LSSVESGEILCAFPRQRKFVLWVEVPVFDFVAPDANAETHGSFAQRQIVLDPIFPIANFFVVHGLVDYSHCPKLDGQA
jgi:hypothetical protein